MTEKWRKDGIIGDNIIRHRGKLYKLWTTVEAKHLRGMQAVKRKAQKKYGEKAKILKIPNTFTYTVYLPYDGAIRPIRR